MDQDKSLLAAEFIKQARAFLMQRRFDLAEENATKAVELDPTQAMGFLVRAESRRMQQKHDEALADADEAIHREPDRAAPYVIRAEILKRRLQFRQAIAQASKALRRDPNNAAAYATRAECHRCLGDLAAAAQDEQELFRIDPTRYTAPVPPPGPLPAKVVNPPDEDENRSRRRPPGAYDDIFADGITPDRSLKSKVLMDADEAAELLAIASSYRPGLEQLRRPGRSSAGVKARRSLLLGFLLGGLVLGVVGYLASTVSRRNAEVPAKPVAKEMLVPPIEEVIPAPDEKIVQVERQPKDREPIERVVPKIVRLDELNTKGWDGEPWLSRDGLTIYWVATPPQGDGLGIWTASRRSTSAPFEGKKWICRGQCPTVRDDGLEMFLIDKRPGDSKGLTLFVTKRSSKDLAFEKPREVPEFRSLQGSWGPSLSRDGLRLCFTRTNPRGKGVEVVEAARTSTSLGWEEPLPLSITGTESLDGDLEYPSITSDGLKLFCCLDKVDDRGQRTRLMLWTRKTTNVAFSHPVFIALPGQKEIEGWCPRFDEVSNSLIFFSAKYDSGDYVDLFSIKHFGEPDAKNDQARLGASGPPKRRESSKTDGKRSLFDGRTLDGWQGDLKTWHVADGELIGSRHIKNPTSQSLLVYEEPFRNFELRLKFKFLTGNSGVFFRCIDKDNNVDGPQIEIINEPFEDLGCLIGYEADRTVKKAGKATTEELKRFFKGDCFNEMQVVCRGHSLYVSINGIQTVDAKFAHMPPDGKFALEAAPNIMTKVVYKDIEVRDLGDEEMEQGIGVGDRSPIVIETNPHVGATDVDPSLSEITVMFNKPMGRGYACCQNENTHKLGIYPHGNGKQLFSEDKKSFMLPVNLKRGTKYALCFNLPPEFMSFRDLDGRPAAPYLLYFQTRK